MKHFNIVTRIFALIGTLAIALIGGFLVCSHLEKNRTPSSHNSQDSKLQTSHKPAFFVSVDGLQPNLVKSLKHAGLLSQPRGLGWLLQDSMVSSEATPAMIPITAASHVSTITCTPPSRHGIVGNSFLKNGQKINGFNEPFTPEPLWRAAMRQGKVVLTLGYVGTDGTTENRQPSLSLAYPQDSLLGPSQTLTWTLSELPPAQGWSLPSELARLKDRTDLRETAVAVTLNPKTQETHTIQVLLAPEPDQSVRLYFAKSKDFATTGYGSLVTSDPTHPVLDFYFTEDHPDSTLKGAKRRVFARTLKAPDGKVSLYLSRVSYNHAFPTSFRQALDDANWVWPDYGVKDPSIDLPEWVEAQAMLDRFLTDVGVKFIPAYGVDIVLFYQPLVDALGHKMQARLPEPFDPRRQDEVTRAYVRAFSIIDENLSRLFSLPGAEGPYMVMGDHGMDPVQTSINVASLLPKDHIDHVDVFSSGDLLLLYPLPWGPDKAAAAHTALEVGEQLRTKLVATSVKDQPVLGFARKKTDYLDAPAATIEREWQYGDAVWAFAGASKFWFQYQPLTQDLVLPPSAYGMHGKSVPGSDMSTLFVAKGAGIPTRDIGAMSLLQAVPTFAKLLGIESPRDCLGQALF